MIIIFLIFYGILAFFIKNRLRLNSKLAIEANRYIVNAVQEVSCLRSEINMGLNPKHFLMISIQLISRSWCKCFISVSGDSSKIFNRRNFLLARDVNFHTLFTTRQALKIIPLIGTIGFAFKSCSRIFNRFFMVGLFLILKAIR